MKIASNFGKAAPETITIAPAAIRTLFASLSIWMLFTFFSPPKETNPVIKATKPITTIIIEINRAIADTIGLNALSRDDSSMAIIPPIR